jgi:hypothetical protein
VIRVYDAVRNVIETHEHKGDFQRLVKFSLASHHTFRYNEFGDSAFIS